jgi:hypothetical protein
MPLDMKRAASFVSLLFICLCPAWSADAAVFRDRAAFEAAAQNLRTIDFDGTLPPPTLGNQYDLDGVRFLSAFGISIGAPIGSTDKRLSAHTIGEITYMTIYLPPGTTAVGLDQFARPMLVYATPGESVTMSDGDGANFVGFVSDQPIQTLTVTLDAPEPTPSALLDNFSYGQRRVGNDPPKPLLLTSATTGRAAAFDSVALTAEPFVVNTPHERNLSFDGRTRVTLLVAGLRLDPSEVPFVTARAVDSQQRVFNLPVEFVGGAKNFSWLGQVNVLLPTELSGAGELSVTVNVRGVESNAVTFRVD